MLSITRIDTRNPDAAAAIAALRAKLAPEGNVVSEAGRQKTIEVFGEPLTPGATGVVPPGCYFAATPHKDGFDSRYAEIGFVCARQVIGTGEPVL